ncbi:MAG: hypothetical protein ACLGIR_07680 [Actinomycetes bacterium]
MRRTLTLTAAALAALATTALPASAAGQACYDVQVVVNGSAVVSEAGCQQLP